MYLHCEHGFVEADAWDGQPIPLDDHQVEVDCLIGVVGAVIVVRSRRSDTIAELIADLPRAHMGGVLPQIKIHASPPGWDYEFRAYLTPIEWGACLTRVAMNLDYRNFKHTMQDRKPREYPLALAIWNAANRDVESESDRPESGAGRAGRFSWSAHK